jgi:hypothetical protein
MRNAHSEQCSRADMCLPVLMGLILNNHEKEWRGLWPTCAGVDFQSPLSQMRGSPCAYRAGLQLVFKLAN